MALYELRPPSRSLTTPAPPGGDDMDTERLTRLETRVETILPTLATKGDVSEAKASIVMWVAGVIAASTVIVVTVLIFAINRAMPPQAQTQAAPIVVYPQQNPPAPQPAPASKRNP